jgi:hypothetical protein
MSNTVNTCHSSKRPEDAPAPRTGEGRQPLGQPIQLASSTPIEVDLEVQVAPRRHARAADAGDVLADLNALADADEGAAIDDVPVSSLIAAVTVILDADVIAVTAVGAGEHDCAVMRCIDRGAASGGQVGARVQGVSAVVWIDAVAVGAGNVPTGRTSPSRR